MTPILSILIPTVVERFDVWDKLMTELDKQIAYMENIHPTLGTIERLFDRSALFRFGGPSIGKKRESLAQRATGKYLCFLDDDEDIAPNYVETLVRLCHTDKDVVTFRSFIKNDFYWSVVDMRLGNANEEATPDRIVKRNAWHVCPVRSKYAKMYKFDDSNYSEDWTWMEKVLKHCETEAHTDQILHSYQHSKKTSEADKITQYELDKKT